MASAPAAELFFLHALTTSQLITLGGGRDSLPPPSKSCLILPPKEPSDLPALPPAHVAFGWSLSTRADLCDMHGTHGNKRQTTVSPWSVLGTWHHGPQGVLSSSSRDPQPKINVSRDSDADLLPPPAPSSDGAGVGRLEEGWLTALPSPGQPVSRWRHQSGDPRPWRS